MCARFRAPIEAISLREKNMFLGVFYGRVHQTDIKSSIVTLLLANSIVPAPSPPSAAAPPVPHVVVTGWSLLTRN